MRMTMKEAAALGIAKKAAPRQPKGKSGQSSLKAFFLAGCKAHGLPEPIPEFVFTSRKWAFDFAWPKFNVALEVEGGVWTGGRHTTGKGFLGDIEKYNAAGLLGFTVYRCTPDDVSSGYVFELLKLALEAARR